MSKNLKVGTEPIQKNSNIKFSFEYYDSSRKYCLSAWKKEQIALTITRLQEVNGHTYNTLKQGSKTMHFHQVDWKQTTERRYPSNAAMNIAQFQFGLLGVNGQKARVFGSYNDGTFYIVWFDLEHKIWPSFKKNT